jgi:hypothetical protein
MARLVARAEEVAPSSSSPLLDPHVAREPQVLRHPRIYLAGEVTPGLGRRPAKPRPAPQLGLRVRAPRSSAEAAAS